MSRERVTLIAGGKEFEGWKMVTVIRGVNLAAPIFRLEVTEVPNDPFFHVASYFEKWHFPPFTDVTLLASGDLMITGKVDSYEPRMAPEAHSVALQGTGQSINVVESSAYHETGEFEEKTPEQISQELIAPTGVKFQVKGKRGLGPKLSIFRIRKGSTVFAELMRIYQARMATLKGEADGSLTAVTGSLGTHQGMLSQGDQIIEMSAKITGNGLFNEYIVDGQGDGTLFDEDIQSEEVARDHMVPTGRRKVIIHPIEADKLGLKNRAEWEKARARGFSVKATLLVNSWRDDTGKLWDPGMNIHVYAPALKVDRMLMIEQVEFRQDDAGGTVAQLQMVSDAAYGGDASAGGDENPGDLFGSPEDEGE